VTVLTAKEQHRAAVFARDPHRCALHPTATGYPLNESTAGPCDGRLQADHILKISALLRHRDRLRYRRDRRGEELGERERYFLDLDPGVWIADERNGWILCERHHGLKDRKLIVVTEEVLLPEHLASFIADYDLLAVYTAEFHPRVVPGSADGPRRRGAP
jgi:hypothetical protein